MIDLDCFHPWMRGSALALTTSLALAGCTPKSSGDELGDEASTHADDTSDETDTTAETGTADTTSGDGDGDSGDGDGDSGDGDGDSGDGDGDSGDGDGDGDTSDACEDGDSGNVPADDDLDLRNGDDPVPAGGFVPPSDIPVSECTIWNQDCPDGEKCVPYASTGGNWDANKCVPVMGDQMPGEACVYGGVIEATDDCDATSYCWDVDDMSMGTCAPFCQGSPDNPICPEGTSCIQGNDSLALCVDNCNPLTQECPEGQACFWSGEAFNCIFTTQDLPAGDPCGFINDCAEGLMCIQAASLPNCAGSACCAEFCDLDCGEGSCAQPGTSCVAFFEQDMAPPGDADIGLCLAM